MATLTMTEPVSPDRQERPAAPRNPDDLSVLTTERAHAASQDLDTKSALEIARIINHEDAKVTRL